MASSRAHQLYRRCSDRKGSLPRGSGGRHPTAARRGPRPPAPTPADHALRELMVPTNPRMAGAAYGFADVGPYNGGRAELLRVTCGDHNCLVLPEEARERRTDYVMLSGMFPTVWHAAE